MRDRDEVERAQAERLADGVGTTHSDLWNVRCTARYLGLHEKTIYDMVARGELPVVRVGRLLRFDPRDVTRWVSARKEGC